ncbi:hypothetical protein QVD17_24516 [Tagetes erecta]|uniref:Transposase-associated domain-containing protein n=1 Tax=Tagetes erecta TaxID=13708 RepID=A0AAD8NV31_TARER|nr:hypothetical protein QVD17_24516 [Tagetes erecta]
MYNISRVDSRYMIGVQDFLKVAEAHRVNEGAQLIFCSCASCKNFQKHDIDYVQFQLLKHGVNPGYTCWSMHGESFANCSTSSINPDNDNITNQYIDTENDALNDNNDNFDDIYLDGVKSICVPESHHSGRLEGVGGVGIKTKPPDYDLLQASHFVVLKHMTYIAPYVNKPKESLRSKYRGRKELWYEKIHNKEFATWMETKIYNALSDSASKQFQSPSQTHTCVSDTRPNVEAYIPQVDAGLFNTEFNAIEELRTQPPQSGQPKQKHSKVKQSKLKQSHAKQTKAKKSMAKDKGKQVGGKTSDHEEQFKKVKMGLERIEKDINGIKKWFID